MAAETPETTETVEERRRRRAAAGTPIADEGDVAFGGMAGIAVLAAILVSLFAVSGILDRETTGATAPVEIDEVDHGDDGDDEPDEVVEPEPEGVDLPSASRALGQLDFTGITLTVDQATGTIITATGEVENEAARAEVISVLESQPNVEEVIDRLVVADAEPAGEAAATVVADSDSIILSGTVQSAQVANELRSAAAAVYEEDQITDELEVDTDAASGTVVASGSLTDFDRYATLNQALSGIDGINNGVTVEGDAAEELTALFELEPVLFQANTNVILDQSLPTLDRAAEILAAFPDAAIEIGGHTDRRGPEDENQILSQSRADAVEAALLDRGVTNDLSAVGYGESQPIHNPDDTLEKQQENRRIEFKAL